MSEADENFTVSCGVNVLILSKRFSLRFLPRVEPTLAAMYTVPMAAARLANAHRAIFRP